MAEQVTTPKRIYLLAHPRTCSNLLVRVLALESQPTIHPHTTKGGGYFFMPCNRYVSKNGHARYGDPNPMTSEEKAKVKQLMQKCFDDLESYASAAESAGKTAFVKEHIVFMLPLEVGYKVGKLEPTWTLKAPAKYETENDHLSENGLVLPDSFLKTWQAVILIRHPALVFASQVRTFNEVECMALRKSKEDFGKDGLGLPMNENVYSFKWQRKLYEWFEKQNEDREEYTGSEWPIVIDADDILDQPAVIRKLCTLCGLDPSKVTYEWQAASAKELAKMKDPVSKIFLTSLSNSAGINMDKSASGIDIDVEAAKWKEEFGEADGLKLEGLVRGAMEDYEWLKERRLRA